MKIRHLTYAVLIASLLACNFLTRMLVAQTPTAAPTLTPSPQPASTSIFLTSAYVPPNCQAGSLATIPASTALVQPTAELQANPEISPALQKKVFQSVVDTIHRVYVYPDFQGKDWPSIAAKYQSEISAGVDTTTFYADMQALITALGDQHSQFESPVDVATSRAELAGNYSYVGTGIIVLPEDAKNQVAIIEVFPNSPAEHSGLKPHDSLLAVDGQPIIKNGVDYDYLLRGPECSATVVTVKSPGGDPRQVMLVRQKIQGPELIDARLVATTDGSRIGYIFIPTFFDDTIPKQIADALTKFGKLDGLILDNRLNTGGSSNVLIPTLSFFTSGTVGQFKSRKGSRPLTITPNPIWNSQDVPLIVLVSKGTVSYGEVFAGILQDSGRAKVAGETSLGHVETLHIYNLDDGSQLWIAEETFDPAHSHANWEGKGIVPDVQSIADWDTFTFETDPTIAAALVLFGHH
jgi:carboxyl-terminal processing protease